MKLNFFNQILLSRLNPILKKPAGVITQGNGFQLRLHFPVITEETGFPGSRLVVLMYMTLLISILRTELLAMDHFGRYLCVGIASVIFFHSVINIGMCIHLMQVTGLPLP